jgi:hypothetical protein
MNHKRISITLALITLGALTIGSRIGSGAGVIPKGWHGNGLNPENYEICVDTAVKHSGKAGAHTKFVGENAEGFGGLMQTIKADDYRGKRLRMSAWMKSENADSAHLWMRLDGAKLTLGFDNMDDRAVKGTTDWKKYEITLDVPKNVVNIAFGVFVAGKGQAWVDDYFFDVVGKDVPSTNMLTPEQMKEEQEAWPSREFPRQPVNLNFEE